MAFFSFSIKRLLIGQVIVVASIVITVNLASGSYWGWSIGLTGVIMSIAINAWVQTKLNRGIAGVSELATALSSGDFTKALETDSQDEFSAIGHSLNAALKKLRRIMRSIEKAAGNLNEFTESSSAAAEKSASLVDEQDDKIEIVAAAMEEMTASISNVAGDIQVTTSRAGAISAQATDAQASLEDLMNGLADLVSSVKKSSVTFDKVEESAKSIDHFMEVITAVADQTNLLALNAAIEAARAGEQGRGFAVVADEVRSLAKRTQESASEISTMTNQLSKHIKATAQVSDEANVLATQASGRAKNTSTTVEDVLHGVQNIVDRMTTVASAMDEQHKVSVDVSKNVTELASISGRSVKLTEQTSKDSEKISQLALELDEELNDFTLKIGAANSH